MCAHVRTCVHVCVINEKAPFLGVLLSLELHITYIFIEFLEFFHVGLFASIVCAGDMAASGASDRAIQIAIVDHHLSEEVRGTLLLGDNLFYNDLISAVNLRSYNG